MVLKRAQESTCSRERYKAAFGAVWFVLLVCDLLVWVWLVVLGFGVFVGVVWVFFFPWGFREWAGVDSEADDLHEHPFAERAAALMTPLLCVQQDGLHCSRGDLQPCCLAVSVHLLLLLEQAPLLRVELSPGHPAARGDCHLPLWLRCSLGWPLASEPCRYVWSLPLTRVLVMRGGHLWFCYRWSGGADCFCCLFSYVYVFEAGF